MERRLADLSTCGGVLLLFSLGAPVAAGAADAETKGSGSLRFEYQYIRTGAFDSSIGEIDIGNTDAHVFMLSGNYALTNRWTIMASLPWIRKRHQGALPHNPVLDFSNYTPPDLTILDDGRYHSSLEDLYVGVQYLAKDGPLSIAPFVSVGVPVTDYPFYAHAAVGRNIWHVPVGVALRFRPYFSDLFFNGDVSYVFTEKSLGVDTSHWIINARAGYYLSPRLAPNVFVSIKHGTKGLDFPTDFDVTDLDNEKWYFHDRIIKHNFVNAGIGLDWILNERYQLSANVMTMPIPDQVNIIDYAWSIGVTRFFSAR